MVLHDVAQRPDRVIETTPVPYAEVLGHGDLHALDVVAVPQRLEDGVANRRNKMPRAASLPRKWSMRRICRSWRRLRSSAFKARADARSWPNGFSTTTRP